MTERPELVIDAEELFSLMRRLLCAVGCPDDIAEQAALVHFEADLRGKGLQGIDYMPYILDYIRSGVISADARAKICWEHKAGILVDGNKGLGQPAALMAVDEAVAKAREFGVCAVGVTNSSDIFMLGFYAERMARAGMVGLAFTAGPPLVHPYGGVERMLSTNPLAFGFPAGKQDPLVFDMATSALSSARIRQAAYHGETVPAGTGIGPDGLPTTDAAAIREGAISPLAGHKGFGIALCVALLSGPLTGSALAPDLWGLYTGEKIDGMGHFFIAVDPTCFQEAGAFEAAANDYISRIKASKKAPGVDEIRIPGEQAFAERERRLQHGVPVLKATWRIISKVAAELDVKLPVAQH